MNNDANLIFEAYKKYITEGTQDENYVPSFKEIKDYLIKSYKDSELRYSNPELFKKRMSDIDSRVSAIEKVIKSHERWANKWNAENSDREPYTVWSSIYSELSDSYKDLNGFRYRTTPDKTPIIVLADVLLDTDEDLQKQFEAEKQEEARPKSHAETLYSNPEKLNADVIALVNDHAEESIQNIATLIDREIIKSVEDQGDGFVSQIAHMIMGLIRRDKGIKLDRQERDALNKELQGMYISKRK